MDYKRRGDADFNEAVFTYDLKTNSWATVGQKTEQFSACFKSDKQALVFNNNIIRVKNGAMVVDLKTNTAALYENPIFAATYQIVVNPDKPERGLLWNLLRKTK